MMLLPVDSGIQEPRSRTFTLYPGVSGCFRETKLVASEPGSFGMRSAKSQQNQRFRRHKKLRPALGGELAARDPVWDGEGGGWDRVAGPVFSLLSAGAGGGGCRPIVAKRD